MDPMQAAPVSPDEQAHRTERHHERSTIFATAAGQPRHMLDSVRRRLILVLALALTPIAALCFAQGFMQIDMQTRDAQQKLAQGAKNAAARVDRMFALAGQALDRLGNLDDMRTAGPACAPMLRGVAAALPFTTNIMLMDTQGQVLCDALSGPGGPQAGTQTPLQAAPDGNSTNSAPTLHLSLREGGKLPDDARIIATLPLAATPQAEAQILAMEISVIWLGQLMQNKNPSGEDITALFTADGRELASNDPAQSAALFSNLPAPSPLSPDNALMEFRGGENADWIYTLAATEQGGLRVAFAMPEQNLFRWSPLTLAASFALPGLIIAFSLLALWLAVDNIVLRWLLYLRRVTAVYAQGHYRFRPNRLKEAPSEFRALGQAVEEMASAVRLRDARLRASLAEKTALVREIHHRIKNSLQIVVSLLSLYGARLEKGEDRRRFEQLRLRVNTLALVHRILYEVAEGSQVQLAELLRELARLLERAGERPLRIRVEAQDAPLSTDMAVPLALMVAEAILSLSLDQSGAASPMQITLDGGTCDGRLHLEIRTRPGEEQAPAALSDLAHGFASQLGGGLNVQLEEGEQVVRGDFPCPAISPQET